MMRHVADSHQTKPNNFDCDSAYRLPLSTSTIAIYY